LEAADELTLRPVRPADYDRIVEMTKDVWEGRDYIPRVFDYWVSDASSSFQAAELDGVVVGVQRTRPFAQRLLWYEGLRVDPAHRRHGIARAMLSEAIDEAREHGFRQLRLATLDEAAVRLFESAGFHKLVELRWWRGGRVEGGEPARIPDEPEAKRLLPAITASPGYELFSGIVPDMNGARDLDAAELAWLANHGLIRVGPGGRAVALLREPWGNNIAVTLLAGRGGALRELLMALRYEADADSLSHVTVNLPPGHPVEEDLKATGYDFADDERNAYIYALDL
jgi:GNAT superfamily N-acetyltransferase